MTVRHKARRVLVTLLAPVLASACLGGSRMSSGASSESVAIAPQLINADEIAELIELEYPAELRAAGVGGTVRLRLFVGVDGLPIEIRLLDSSGRGELDAAAERVARALRFSPATNHNGDPVRVWASFPITFRTP